MSPAPAPTRLVSRRRCLLGGMAVLGAPYVARAQSPAKLRIATEGANPPWNYVTPQGQVAGLDVEIATELCKRMGTACEVSAQAWDGIIPGLIANRFDAIVAGMAITPARAERVAFTTPYRKIISAFITRKGTTLDTGPEGLRGKRIGVQRGASQHIYLQNAGYEKTATIVLYDTVGGPELDLATGRVDLIIMNKVTAFLGLMKRPEGAGLAFVGPDYGGGVLGEGAGIALRKEDTALLARFNAVIADMKADGSLSAIYDKAIPFPMV